MREKASDLPKRDPRRNAIAQQIREARKTDRSALHLTDRVGWEYVEQLKGVQHMFEYVRGLSSHRVLDVGAGDTKGTHDLSRSPFGAGLEFEAVVLTNRSVIEEHLGRDRTHNTSVEMLRGIEDSSIGCVIAVFSLAYSAQPSLAIEGIDRVLVPGGVLKARFLKKDTPRSESSPQFALEFREALAKLGYDVAIDNTREVRVLLAIKPGKQSSAVMTAAKLMKADDDSGGSQVHLLLKTQGGNLSWENEKW